MKNQESEVKPRQAGLVRVKEHKMGRRAKAPTGAMTVAASGGPCDTSGI